jgi:hypothetical protein
LRERIGTQLAISASATTSEGASGVPEKITIDRRSLTRGRRRRLQNNRFDLLLHRSAVGGLPGPVSTSSRAA